MKKFQAQLSDSSDASDKIQEKSGAKKKGDAYDYFLKKENPGLVTESDEFSESVKSQQDQF